MKTSPVAAVVLLMGAGVIWVCPVRSREGTQRASASNGIALRMGCKEGFNNASQCVEMVSRVAAGTQDQGHPAPDSPKRGVLNPPLPHAVAAGSARAVRMKGTGHCLCRNCCEKWSGGGKTSIGDDARIYDGVAADPKLLPYRTRLEIPGIGIKEVDDTGGGMRKSAREGVTHIDVRMPSHSAARQWGARWLEVKILK